jgi:hypothetical protein
MVITFAQVSRSPDSVLISHSYAVVWYSRIRFPKGAALLVESIPHGIKP